MDKVDCNRLLDYLKGHGEQLTEGIRQRTYRPNSVRRAEMPKDNGKKRRLGIPTAVGRVIQQAIAQTLTPIHERQSSGGSYGFHEETREGTPQGGPPSPLLANELDKELERRGHPFVRHADDGLIFCKGRRGRGDAGAFAENLAADGRTERRNSAKKTESAYVVLP